MICGTRFGTGRPVKFVLELVALVLKQTRWSRNELEQTVWGLGVGVAHPSVLPCLQFRHAAPRLHCVGSCKCLVLPWPRFQNSRVKIAKLVRLFLPGADYLVWYTFCAMVLSSAFRGPKGSMNICCFYGVTVVQSMNHLLHLSCCKLLLVLRTTR
jgi:hypothetical protein